MVAALMVFSAVPPAAEAQILDNLINVLRDPLRSGTTEYSGVIHGFESLCYRPQGAMSCLGETRWITAGYVLNKGWWYRYSPLANAYLSTYGRYGHVLWADPNMNQIDGNLNLYHHTPQHGTNDGWNRVGWEDWINNRWTFGYARATWDIPNGARNDVAKTSGGRFLRNWVAVPSSTSLWDAKASWSKVVAGNTLEYGAVPGWDGEITVSTTTWNRDWDWGCFCWRDTYRYQYDDWVVDYA